VTPVGQEPEEALAVTLLTEAGLSELATTRGASYRDPATGLAVIGRLPLLGRAVELGVRPSQHFEGLLLTEEPGCRMAVFPRPKFQAESRSNSALKPDLVCHPPVQRQFSGSNPSTP
jgi:hypothetical protein